MTANKFRAQGWRLADFRRAARAPRGKRVVLAVLQPELGVAVQNSLDLNPLDKLKELKSTLFKHYILLGLAGPAGLQHSYLFIGLGLPYSYYLARQLLTSANKRSIHISITQMKVSIFPFPGL